MPNSSATGRAVARIQPGRQEGSRAAAEAQDGGYSDVSVFLSGRPMWVNPELNASDAFVAAFLPGGEGGGIADVIFRKARRARALRFPRQAELQLAQARRPDAAQRRRQGLRPAVRLRLWAALRQKGDLPKLSEERPKGGGLPEGVLFGRGTVPQGWSFAFEPASGGQMKGIDRRRRRIRGSSVWTGNGPATAAIHANPPLDLSRETTGQLSLVIDYRVDQPADRAGDARHGRRSRCRSADVLRCGSRRAMADADAARSAALPGAAATPMMAS